jgi:hypothetical protein
MTCSSCCLTEENRLHTWEETENTLTVPLIYPEGCGGPGKTPAFIVRPAAPHAGAAHLRNALCRGGRKQRPGCVRTGTHERMLGGPDVPPRGISVHAVERCSGYLCRRLGESRKDTE